MEGPSLRGPALGLAGLPTQQDCSIQEKIDLEIRMREGIWKLLSLSTQKDQVLHAVKNLMVCNARIMAYTSELQKLEEQIANQTGRWLDCSIQEKIDLEIRMREGIWKLLSLSTQKDQVLHAVKNLMVCNARIMAYTSELQKLEEQIANQTGR
ncbi:PREDICTED: rhotekin-2-like, partial [Mandrillus leucophaeus]|uniref:rhotekin-2-like n=1 Tax=Mandrillus leucophaeus TaxID=9568 RepID=UPI0005F560BF